MPQYVSSLIENDKETPNIESLGELKVRLNNLVSENLEAAPELVRTEGVRARCFDLCANMGNTLVRTAELETGVNETELIEMGREMSFYAVSEALFGAQSLGEMDKATEMLIKGVYAVPELADNPDNTPPYNYQLAKLTGANYPNAINGNLYWLNSWEKDQKGADDIMQQLKCFSLGTCLSSIVRKANPEAEIYGITTIINGLVTLSEGDKTQMLSYIQQVVLPRMKQRLNS